MSRQLVSVQYRNDRAVALDPQTGEVVKEFVPETVIGISNSIGGYYLRGTSMNGQTRVELVRVSGGEKHLPLEKIWQLAKDRKGEAIRPGLMLMATSSGAARNGVFHRYHAPKNPLEYALRDRRCSFRIVEQVEVIDIEVSLGGNLCQHSTTPGNWRLGYVTDCMEEVVRDGEYVQAHANRYHVGCMSSPATYRLHGGTFVVTTVTRKMMPGYNATEVTKVTVTPQADLQKVADAVRNA